MIVRDIFVAKPGNASKLAKMFKKAMPQARIMTDLVGEYNTVVMETQVADLAAFERMMEEYRAGKLDPAAAMKGYTEMYLTGRREIFRIEE